MAALIRNGPGGRPTYPLVPGVGETIGVALFGRSLAADYRLHIPTVFF